MLVEQLLTVAFLSNVLGAGMRLAMPLLYAALGEVFAERAGILNISIEGMMLVGAFCGFLGAYAANSPWVGLLCAMAGAGALSLIHAYLSITLGAEQVISGIALNFLALGLVTILNRAVFGLRMLPPTAPSFQPIEIPWLSGLPVVGSFLFSHHALVYIGLVLVPLVYLALFKTTFGLRVAAVGEDPRGAEAVGISVSRLRYVCVLLGGMFAGLGGVTLSLANLNFFKETIVSGRGFIAIAIVMFARWNPLATLGAALIFGTVDALQLHLQSLGMAAVPSQVFISLPYLATILFLVIQPGGSPPAALSVPYVKEG